MENKKTFKANIEKDRVLYFEIGMIVTLSLTLMAFEWSVKPKQLNDLMLLPGRSDIKEIIISTERKPEEPKKELPQLLIINPVSDQTDVPILELPGFDDIPEEVDNWANFVIPNDEPDEVYDFVVIEDKPLFMGEKPEKSFRRYIAENVKYPQEAIDNNVVGRVTIKFIVDEKGRIIDAEVVQGVHPVIDEAALRVITSSPLWTPGKQRGKAVKVRYYFPVIFKLTN
jgi:protein TonB